MSDFIVNGGKKLQGIYPISGAKNAAPKLLIAALLTDQKCTFSNIARFSDTFKSIGAMSALGGSVRFLDDHTVEIECKDIFSSEIPHEATAARQATLFIGATLARTGKVKTYPPKGDKIGKRPLNRHYDGLRAMGAIVTFAGEHIEIVMPKRPKGCTYRFEKNTHSGTENLILAAVFNDSKVTLENAAAEPEVDNLIQCLNQMGARIKRTAPRTIEIEGVEPLLRGVEFRSVSDRLETATALTLSALHGGEVIVENAERELVTEYEKFLNDIGIELEWDKDQVSIKSINEPLKPTKIVTAVHPGFMTDWQPLASLLLLVKAEGKSTIHEMIFEKRWRYLSELEKMGAKYETFEIKGESASDFNFNDSEYVAGEHHGAYLHGPTNLKAAEVTSADVRAGIDMLLAATVADGESLIHDPAGHIDRGYENIVGKLANLGADISRA